MQHGMLAVGIFAILFSIEGITLSFIYSPVPYALVVSACINLLLIFFSECLKTYLLIEKMHKKAMCYLVFLILQTLYFTIIGISVLVYLAQLQNGRFAPNEQLRTFLISDSSLTSSDLNWMNLTFYFGTAIFDALYTRSFYRMFWVNSIIHIYRYLKKKVGNLNETLTNGLPVIFINEELKGSNCSLCLEEYREEEQLTKLPCRHVFHRSCIRLWVIRSNACPLCRKRVIFR